MKILIITTSHNQLGDTGYPTGVWLEELAAPYYVFADAGVNITVASPQGGTIPLDPKSEADDAVTEATKRFLNDTSAMHWLIRAVPLADVDMSDYDAVFLPGGHGPMWDLADNPVVNRLLEEAVRSDKPIGAVCHGVAGIAGVHTRDGQPIAAGKNLTAFTNSEEELVKLTNVVPFLLESRLREQGAHFTQAADFHPYVVTDGLLVTGQNPASSEEAARAILHLLKK